MHRTVTTVIISVTVVALGICCAVAEHKSAEFSEHTGGQKAKILDIKGAQYRAQWQDDYNYDTPILIDDHNSLNTFLNQHQHQNDFENALREKFDESFFENSVIYAYVKSEPSGSNQLKVDRAVLKENVLELHMINIIPEMGTMDMAARVCFFGIRRADLEGVESVEARIEVKREELE